MVSANKSTFWIDEINKILENYTEEDKDIVEKTIDMLCAKGIGKGVYQDYAVLADIVTYLSIFASIVGGLKDGK